MKIAIVWFRNDLRLHDNEALTKACEWADQVIPVYIFDPRQFQKSLFGFAKTGPFRAQFLLESVENLRRNLRNVGSDLIVRTGFPEEILPAMAEKYKAVWVFAHKEVAPEEKEVESKVEKALFGKVTTLELYWGSTLFHLEDLPLPVRAIPDVFTHFRNQIEKYAKVRATFPAPWKISTPVMTIPGEMPSLADLGVKMQSADARSVLKFQGGETAALERLQTYFWKNDRLKVYKDTRNELIGADYSSKFSAWLANGSLSPRHIYHEVLKYEAERKKNDSTYWMIFELLWRDYFRFIGKKFGSKLFLPGGIKDEPQPLRQDWERFQAWADGMTGIPFVDANMRELKSTGFMSNRGRQNVASFLVKDLGIDWRMGADYFESVLIDYDVCSNWGNWNYVAGVGNDPRENRYFSIPSQAERYDPKGAYVKLWLPELRDLPPNMIHQPYRFYPSELQRFRVSLGGSYPFPIINLDKKAEMR